MIKNEKAFSLWMILGAGILLVRTIRLLVYEEGLIVLALWVKVLTFIEMSIDISCIIFSFKWLLNCTKRNKTISLRLGATVALFHALRVFIYVLGRIGPWKDFDKTSEYRLTGDVNLFWVYFAGILSVAGVLGVLLIGEKIKKEDR